MRDPAPRVLELGARMKEIVEIENVVVGRGRRPHGCLHCCDELREGRARPGPARLRSIRAVRVSGQAALDSIWVTLLGVAPLIAIRRGFIASGISRCRSMSRRPFSKRAPLNSAW